MANAWAIFGNSNVKKNYTVQVRFGDKKFAPVQMCVSEADDMPAKHSAIRAVMASGLNWAQTGGMWATIVEVQ